MATVNWQERCERLTAENERLRAAVIAVRERAEHLPHIIMPNGQTLKEFCRATITGPVLPPTKRVPTDAI